MFHGICIFVPSWAGSSRSAPEVVVSCRSGNKNSDEVLLAGTLASTNWIPMLNAHGI
jgi:hypothetical protein